MVIPSTHALSTRPQEACVAAAELDGFTGAEQSGVGEIAMAESFLMSVLSRTLMGYSAHSLTTLSRSLARARALSRSQRGKRSIMLM